MTISEQNLSQNYSTSWNSCSQAQYYALHFLAFVFGLSIGITASSYFQSIPFSSQATFDPLSSPPIPYANNDVSEIISGEILMKNISDKELLRIASRVPVRVMFVPKVAFMFLTKGGLPLTPLWEKFFEGYQGLYSVYVHTNPSHVDSWPSNSVFHGRTIPSQPVIWGTATMVDAERRLIAHALLHPSNQRFVLLSESCIPLFNFKTIYDYLIDAHLSMVESYDIPGRDGRGRYNPKMSPQINVTNWRKGSQWFEANRELAIHIVSDKKYYGVFKEHCVPPCFMDEHYIPTLSNLIYPELISNRSVTWVDWSKSGPHPRKYGLGNNITDDFLSKVRFGKELCVYNGVGTSKCFLFARKFSPNALLHLLRLLFDSGP